MDKPNSSKIKLIFMGTPEFAVPGLSALLTDPVFQVQAVFTRPDKPVGRRQIITPPAIKRLALSHDIPVFQPLKIKEAAATIASLQPDFIVVIAYGQIIPASILDIPKYGGINVHGSLLPRYRGAACLSAPILNGDPETGLTIMQMAAGLDTGPIFQQAKIPLSENDDVSYVHDRLAELSAQILPEALKKIAAGQLKAEEQDESLASYVPLLKKEDGRIDWQKPAREIKRQILALNPWPGTYANLPDGRMLKIIAAHLLASPEDKRQPGELYRHKNDLLVQSGQDSLVILKLQIAGGRPMSPQDFLAGNADLLGQVLS